MEVAEVKKKPSKGGYKKVRTGCITCKVRRIKCDEAKPQCLRCSSTGRKCDGYEFEARVSQANAVQHNICFEVPGTKKEKRSFQFFRSCTAPDLCGYHVEEFWDRNILQASFQEPALRHAIVALGSLHESFVLGLAKPETASQPPDLFAVRQHTKALSSLHRSLSKGVKDVKIALMSCILFVCFNSMLGDFDSAITHLRSGLSIINSNSSPELKPFRAILARLGIQAMFFVDLASRENIGYMWDVADSDSNTVDDNFHDMEEARQSLNNIIDKMVHFFYYVPDPPPLEHQTPKQDSPSFFPSPNSEISSELIPAVLTPLSEDGTPQPYFVKQPAPLSPPVMINQDEIQVSYARNLLHWSSIFNTFLKRKDKDLTSRDLRAAVLLKIHYTVALTMIQATLSPMQDEIYDFGHRFETIIKLCGSLARAETPTDHALFTYHMGLIGPLYYAAINTRSKHLREQALEILSVPRREGMWDSRIAGFVIARVMALEEAGVVMSAGNDMGSTAHPDRVDTIVFNRTPRDAADNVQIELRGAVNGQWTTFGNLIEWNAPTKSQVPGVWKDKIQFASGPRTDSDLRRLGGVDI